MKHLVNVFYRLRRKPVFQHLLIHGQKHLRCEFAQFYGAEAGDDMVVDKPTIRAVSAGTHVLLLVCQPIHKIKRVVIFTSIVLNLVAIDRRDSDGWPAHQYHLC